MSGDPGLSPAILRRLVDAVEECEQQWHLDTFGALGEQLTCGEVEALNSLLGACGLDEYAEALMDNHRDGDREGDLHYEPPS